MNRPASAPWTERFLEMLQDGPVEKEYAIVTLSGLVPPGQAWRTYERTYRQNAIKRGTSWVDGETKIPVTEDGVRSGSRQMIVASFNQLRHRGRIEQYEENGRVMFRYVRDKIVIRGEQASERARRAALTLTEAERRERAKAASRARTPEERSVSARKGWDDERRAKARLIGMRQAETMDRAQRSQQIRESLQRIPKEKRVEIAKRRWDNIDAEARRERALKGAETRRRRAWFRERAERQDETVPTRPEGGVQPDQRGGERGTTGHHEGSVG